jgi:hypothetical protein
MLNAKLVLPIALILPVAFGGCGLFVPEKDLFPVDQYSEGNFESMIVRNIKCELHTGVQNFLNSRLGESPRGQFIRDWGAQVQLKIQVEEMSGLTPGVTLNTPFENSVKTFPVGGNVLTPRSFALGLGASGTAHATRVETISFTYSFRDLLSEPLPEGGLCNYDNGFMIQSDLKIGQFIFDKMVIATAPGVAEAFISKTASPFSVFSDDITFVASFGGSVTPIWHLARVSVDPTGTLLNATRTNTDDVIITLGQATRATATSPAKLSDQANQVHNANLIGSATGSSISSQAH